MDRRLHKNKKYIIRAEIEGSLWNQELDNTGPNGVSANKTKTLSVSSAPQFSRCRHWKTVSWKLTTGVWTSSQDKRKGHYTIKQIKRLIRIVMTKSKGVVGHLSLHWDPLQTFFFPSPIVVSLSHLCGSTPLDISSRVKCIWRDHCIQHCAYSLLREGSFTYFEVDVRSFLLSGVGIGMLQLLHMVGSFCLGGLTFSSYFTSGKAHPYPWAGTFPKMHKLGLCPPWGFTFHFD
jgi:hypothetical protein